jgi:8-oxo-dGTP diphosphatase
VALTDPAGRLLMQLRDDAAPGAPSFWAYPGLWSLFGGEVEPGESLRAAAAREIAEETGLALDPAALAPLGATVSRWSAAGVRLFVYAAATAARPCDLRIGEGAGFAFLTRAQIAAFPVIPEMRAIILGGASPPG